MVSTQRVNSETHKDIANMIQGPMVYGLFYLPENLHHSLLAQQHRFDDSKVLTARFRASLMQSLCTPGADLFEHCGWATRVISAREISAGMLKRTSPYNLNAQAMDATVDLIKSVLAHGINISHIYIDTIGKPETYQKKLETIFPAKKFTVAKKADSLFPCVSAASVCAKVTRDKALETSYETAYGFVSNPCGWGSGYPSDVRCSRWLKENVHPVFGWSPECRFSWGTAKELLETKNDLIKIEWPLEGDHISTGNISDFFMGQDSGEGGDTELTGWFGQKISTAVL